MRKRRSDLNHFAEQLRRAAGQGKHFLFRSAASLLTALAGLPVQPVAAQDMARYVRGGKPGAVIVGSHVRKTTAQLGQLLKMPGVAPIEVDVEQLPAGRDALLAEIVRSMHVEPCGWPYAGGLYQPLRKNVSRPGGTAGIR